MLVLEYNQRVLSTLKIDHVLLIFICCCHDSNTIMVYRHLVSVVEPGCLCFIYGLIVSKQVTKLPALCLLLDSPLSIPVLSLVLVVDDETISISLIFSEMCDASNISKNLVPYFVYLCAHTI
ncbi:hypothetical protein QVD17_29861 [Tagetes erecta]|uniref:Uncharacterized protein n=1 Tax=Tagetes erecta TaxID=13708 RepID=A0AAD8NFH4_TARER|nr:hypothetical protein QVD17_29861 [Tagetes erecta]